MLKFLTGILIISWASFTLAQSVRERIIHLRVEAQTQVHAETERDTDTYRRVHAICTQGLDLARIIYATESAKQVLQLSLLDRQALADLKDDHSLLSPLLAHDLEDYGYYLALQDCHYTEAQAKWFTLDLITLDLSGKLLGAVGAVLALKYTARVFMFFWRRAPVTTVAVSAGSLIWRISRTIMTKNRVTTPHTLNETPVTILNVNSHFDLSPTQKSDLLIAQAGLQLLDQDIAKISSEMQTASPKMAAQMANERKNDLAKRELIAQEFGLNAN